MYIRKRMGHKILPLSSNYDCVSYGRFSVYNSRLSHMHTHYYNLQYYIHKMITKLNSIVLTDNTHTHTERTIACMRTMVQSLKMCVMCALSCVKLIYLFMRKKITREFEMNVFLKSPNCTQLTRLVCKYAVKSSTGSTKYY